VSIDQEKHQQALAVHGDIAVYSTPVHYSGSGPRVKSVIRALNLSTGKDRPVGYLPGEITLASMDSTGLVYATTAGRPARGTSTGSSSSPLEQVAAAVS
jgi:hypothetical protein